MKRLNINKWMGQSKLKWFTILYIGAIIASLLLYLMGRALVYVLISIFG